MVDYMKNLLKKKTLKSIFQLAGEASKNNSVAVYDVKDNGVQIRWLWLPAI